MISAMFDLLRAAARPWRRQKLLAFTVVVTVGTSIAFTALGFDVFNAIVLKEPPYQQAKRLRSLSAFYADGARPFSSMPIGLLRAIALNSSHFERVSYFREEAVRIDAGQPLTTLSALVDSGYYRTLGLAPAAGRFPDAQEIQEQQALVVVSAQLASRLGPSYTSVVGSTLRLNDRAYTVVGVAPAELSFRSRIDVWLPFDCKLPNTEAYTSPTSCFASVFARLRPSATTATVRAELDALSLHIAESDARFRDWHLYAQETLAQRDRSGTGDGVMVLLVLLSGGLLVVACTNVANLLLSRSIRRSGELALRGALGASKTQLLRQVWLEHLALAAGAAVLGTMLLSVAVASFQQSDLYAGLPGWVNIAVDYRVIAFVAMIAAMAMLVFVMPVVRFAAAIDLV